MIRCIVFSRERPLQLDGLLRSINHFAQDLYDEIVVIAKPQTMAEGYRIVGREWPRVEIVNEIDFRHEVIAAVTEDMGPGDVIGFHTDDDLWFGPAPYRPSPNRTVHVSLRLGDNTTFCHPLAVTATAVPPSRIWAWAGYDGDFGYPFSLDGHLYNANLITELLAGLDFDRPNDLEHQAVTRMLGDPERWGPFLARPAHSCVVSVPLNRVNEGYPNPASTEPATQPQALYQAFLEGWRMDLSAMDFSDVRGAHQEIPLFLRRGEEVRPA